ncbi:hypothetical protein [Variovorax sp. YR216]|uniref:hypothetical protein n=1 Tax=Variovorax sp. YR216 TaxID=1882828 RepID=UPI000896989D|nr:hypothetical protein [Variovorax sp. YR216]SEA55934.1 cytochrome b561 [Variovorax sp. YR216]
MEFKNSSIRYSKPLIGLHWLTLVLLAAVYACMELRGFAPKGSDLRANMKTMHFLIGLHAAAALVHHYVTRDNTLVRMLP